MNTLIKDRIDNYNQILKPFLISFFIVLANIPVEAQLDFKYDSVLYKTMYPHYLRDYLENHPEAVLIDVRSPGEFSDTSMYKSLNLGHIKGAINIPKDSIQNSLGKLEKLKNTPVVIYCSHSSRSRRACKQLSENGFTQIINVNGGMSWMSQADESEFPGRNEMVISLLPYKNLSIPEGIKLIRNDKDLVVLDVRNKTEFENKDTSENLNIGRIKKAINIPIDQLKQNISPLMAYRNKDILIYDNRGISSNIAAKLLMDQGFTKVNNLNGGLSDLIEKSVTSTRMELIENQPSYSILNAKETIRLLFQNKNLVVIDLRPNTEFQNQAKESWKNRGIVKNAINIPGEKFWEQIATLNKYKQSEILVYGSSEAAKYCKILVGNGFNKVNLIYGGIYSLIYTYANVEGYRNAKAVLDNYAGLY